MGYRRWGVLVILAVVCAGLGAWFVLQGGEAEAPAAPPPPSPQPAVGPLDLDVPEPEITVAATPAEAAAPVVKEPSIRGRVADTQGRPVPEAAIAVYEPNKGARRVYTDAAGAFAVGDLELLDYRVSAQKAHYNEAVVEKVRPGRHDLVLVLTPMSAASGRVVDEAGKPVPEFEVVYLRHPPDGPALWKEICRNPRTPWQAFTDPEGRFEIADVASGAPFGLGARAPGFEPAFVAVPAVEPGQPAQPAEIRLSAEARVAGVVVSPDGEPVARATLHLGADTDEPPIAETDVDGQFELAGLGTDRLVLTANHDRYLPGQAEVTPRRGETVSVRIAMDQGGRVEGTVYRGKEAVPGQSVAVSRLVSPRIRKQTVTGPDGRYVVEGIGLGTVDVLARYKPDAPDAVPRRLHRQAEIEPGRVTVVDFHFPAEYAVVEGTVTVNGEPVAGAEIQGTVTNEEGQSYFRGRSGEDGRYRIGDAVPGSAWLEVTYAMAEGTELRKSFSLELPEGGTVRQDVPFETTTGVSGVVTNLRPGDVGQVLALQGHVAVDTSTVDAILSLERIRAGQADIDEGGGFAIEGLEPGPHTLVALIFSGEADTGEEAIGSIRVGTQTITVPPDGSAQASISLGP